jgi:hypothetical protein
VLGAGRPSRHRRSLVILTVMILLLSLLLTAQAPASAPRIDEIVITSCTNCAAENPHEVLRAERRGNAYYANGTLVDDRLVDRLAAALKAPVIPGLDLPSIGVTPSWLHDHAEAALQSLAGGSPTPRQSVLFVNNFENIAVMERVIHRYYDGLGWTDDYPRVTVNVRFGDGHSVAVTSLAQKDYMLPWTLRSATGVRETFNAGISRAIAALLPVDTSNRKRLLGAHLVSQLAGALVSNISDEWTSAQMQDIMPVYFSEVQKNYQIRQNQGIGCFSGYDAGACPMWAVTLAAPDLPRNVAFFVVLPLGDRPQGMEHIAKTKDAIQALLNATWLKSYLSSNPDVELLVDVNRTGSFGPEAQRAFDKDMASAGKTPLKSIDEPLDSAVHASLVRRDNGHKLLESDWLLFPNGESILWKFSGFPGPLGPDTIKATQAQCLVDLESCTSGVVLLPNGAVAR